MKTSVLIAAILLVSILASAQQSQTETANFDNQMIGENIESSEQTNTNVNLFKKHTFDKPLFKTEISGSEFDPIQFSTNLSACSNMGSTGELMKTVKETLSYSGKLMFNDRKFEYITGMTGNGVGMKIRL